MDATPLERIEDLLTVLVMRATGKRTEELFTWARSPIPLERPKP